MNLFKIIFLLRKTKRNDKVLNYMIPGCMTIHRYLALSYVKKEDEFMPNRTNTAIDRALEGRLDRLTQSCLKSGSIDLNLYSEYDVKRGLRDANGRGRKRFI